MTIAAGETDKETKSPIQKFYSGQSIFITGGTGFVGILLVEKLLRTCYDLSMIYLLIRPKKGLDPKQRLDKIFADEVYDRLKKEVPKFREKVTLVEGDCSLPGLGMSVEDKAMLEREVSIVFHSAASVNLDQNLKTAVLTNVVSTTQIMEMCKNMPKLKAVIYVSTAFCNSANPTIEEKFYEPHLTHKNMINIVENLSNEMLEKIKKQLLGTYPDSYAFTKSLSEQVVQHYGQDLPAGVFRPAIILSTYKEPIEGWINNMYGTVGITLGVLVGVLRTVYIDVDATAENVPADYTVNALLSTAWDVANKKRNGMDPLVYNYTSVWNKHITWKTVTAIGMKHYETMPIKKAMWYPAVIQTKCRYYNKIMRVFLHLIPALFIDGVLKIIGKKPMLLRLYKKTHKFMDVLSYYMLLNVTFPKQNVINMWDSLNQQDQGLFHFSMKDFEWSDYLKVSLFWGKKYLLHEDLSQIPQAVRNYQMLKILHYTIKYVVLLLLGYYLFRMVLNWWL